MYYCISTILWLKIQLNRKVLPIIFCILKVFVYCIVSQQCNSIDNYFYFIISMSINNTISLCSEFVIFQNLLLFVGTVCFILLFNLYFTICPAGHLLNFSNLIVK